MKSATSFLLVGDARTPLKRHVDSVLVPDGDFDVSAQDVDFG